MSESAVEATEVTYRIGGAELLRGIDLTAAWGELLAIIGPNGAGKSTLLGVLAGDLTPSAGTVMINGILTRNLSNQELALTRAVLTQRSPIDIPYTARQVVSMGRYPHRRSADNTSENDDLVINRAMSRTDTARFARRVYATLSGGERTRVSLARVLAQDTPVVLLDEPTTALDVAYQERIMRDAAAIADEGRSVVAVLHDLNAAAVHADTIVLLSEGRVMALGDPRSVLDGDLLSEVYGQPMVVVDHPLRDCPLVLTAEE